MSMIRTDFECDIEVISQLHVGNGSISINESGQELSLVFVEEGKNAWIPGSTLKGAFRSAFKRDYPRLFGSPHQKDTEFAKGMVTFFGAVGNAPPSKNTQKQTAIHRGTGAAKSNLLFERQMVSKGTLFRFRARLKSPSEDHERLCADFFACLGLFSRDDGLCLGRNKSDGEGRVKLCGKVSMTRVELTASGYDVPRRWAADPDPSPAPVALKRINLQCRGPYHTFHKDIETKTDKGIRTIALPMRSNNGKPTLATSGVSGALRTRAEWLLATSPEPKPAKSCLTTSGTMQLDVVQRLFGEEGYRGSLNVRSKNRDMNGQVDLTSTSIDRFTGGSYGSALYTVSADTGVSFDLEFEQFRALDDDEEQFLGVLVRDIEKNGLKLGKNTARGFGWFSIASKQVSPAKSAKPTTVDVDPRAKNLRRLYFAAKAKFSGKEAIVYLGIINNLLENAGQPPATMAELEATIGETVPTAATARVRSAVHPRAPSDRVTLPYRHIKLDLDKVGRPEPIILKAYQNNQLHNVPLAGGLCASIEVTWVFDRPMLVSNGAGEAIRFGKTPALPGSTVRGNIRSILEAVTSAKMHRVTHPAPSDAHLWKSYKNWEAYQASPHATPTSFSDEFKPDFVECLFGFIHKIEGQDMPSKRHDFYHLKSRVLFDVAWLERDKVAESEHHLVVNGPNPSSKIYDQLGWKRYPIDDEAGPALLDCYLGKEPKNKRADNVVAFKLLSGSAENPLRFRGRIDFHNVTAAELGAVLWAITWDWSEQRRHKIGFCKPFGAGQCRADDLTLHITPNPGSDRDGVWNTGADLPPEFNLHGVDPKPFIAAFRDYLCRQKLLNVQSYDEMLASATPGAVPDLSAYQVWTTTRHGKGLKDIAPQIRAQQGGRLTAMLRPAPKDGESQ